MVASVISKDERDPAGVTRIGRVDGPTSVNSWVRAEQGAGVWVTFTDYAPRKSRRRSRTCRDVNPGQAVRSKETARCGN